MQTMQDSATLLETIASSLTAGDTDQLEETSDIYKAFGFLILKTPGELAYIASAINKRERSTLPCTLQDLDEIADGQHAEHWREELGDGTHLESFLDSLDWWVFVFGCASKGLMEPHDSWGGDPAFVSQRAHGLALYRATLDAYCEALAITDSFAGLDRDVYAHLKFVQSYRVFTRYVCSFAQEVWPAVDFTRLRSQF
jgi:hypothetical protein